MTSELRSELKLPRKEATSKGAEVGRLAGEGDALRAQVRELIAAIAPPQGKK